MQLILVFSLSTTTESMFRPKTVITDVEYLFEDGLTRSTSRPLTPGNVRLRFCNVSLSFASFSD